MPYKGGKLDQDTGGGDSNGGACGLVHGHWRGEAGKTAGNQLAKGHLLYYFVLEAVAGESGELSGAQG